MVKTKTKEERSLPRTRRLRKKLHVGEFAVQCVSFKMQVDIPNLTDEIYDTWVDNLFEFVYNTGIEIGFAGGGPNELLFSIDKIGLTEQDIEAVEEYVVHNTPNLIRAERTCDDDAWYPEINTDCNADYQYGLVYEDLSYLGS